jgi:N-acetylmuramoyl-L-alanine amidase
MTLFIGALLRLRTVIVACALLMPAVAVAEPHIAFDARIAGDELRTRIVIDFESEPSFSIHYLAEPARVIVDLPETVFGFEEDDLPARGVFEAIRYGAMGPGRSRLVLTAPGPVEVEMAKVEAREDGRGHRLVIDAIATSDEAFAGLVTSQDWQTTGATGASDAPLVGKSGREKPFTVVIDAGHGGIDNGAIGKAGTQEKDVTLAFSRILAERLGQERNVRVIQTRQDDRFISLSGRVRVARQHQADLMLSIHADSIRLPDIRGATVYTLSDKASDRMAADLARQENNSDAIAGFAAVEEDAEVMDILMDLTRRETQVFSIGLARSVVEGFRGEILLINNPHRFAGFSVLRAPDVPSLLVELGYLSNVEDEKLLLDTAWRARTADLLADAILGFRSQISSAAKDL